MALNEAWRAALKALSYPDIDLTKNYKLWRAFQDAAPALISKISGSARDIEIAGVPVRVFTPDEGARRPGVLLFFHGGGWVTGSIVSYHTICSHLCENTGRTVLSVGYRLAPEHRFPAGLEDCYAVTQALLSGDPAFPVAPEDVTLVGDSAGGNLAAAVSLLSLHRGGRLPRQEILFYPVTQSDFTEDSPFPSVRENGTDYLLTARMMREYLALYVREDEDAKSPYLAPLYAPSLRGMPPTLVVTAQYDPLRDEGEAFARRLTQEGVPTALSRVDDALHGFLSLPPRFSQTKLGYELICNFLAETQAVPVDSR